MVKLTGNEKRTLKMLLENGRSTDTEIAKKLRITKQAVGKIRKKLEDAGVIRGYNTDLDYGKLGINTFAIAILKFSPKSWEDMGELGIEQKIKELPNMINIYRIPEGNTTHIVLCGFRNLTEMDRYFHAIKTVPSFNNYINIEKIYIFSNQSLLKDSSSSLFKKVIDELGKENSVAQLNTREIDMFRERVIRRL